MPRIARSLVAICTTSLSLTALSIAWVVAAPAGAQCASASEPVALAVSVDVDGAFVTAINELRVSNGLNALVADGNLGQIAQDWSTQMAAVDGISHRADL